MRVRAAPVWLPGPVGAQTAQDLFTATFGGAPDGVWAAPGRVNLIGEHLDYNGGPVLPFALAHATLAAVRARDDGQVHLVSAADPAALHGAKARWSGSLATIGPVGGPLAVPGWASYVAGVLWALREAGHDVPGIDVAITSAVPLGAGLSSSAALECSVALAVADLLGMPTDDAGRAALAAACVRAENEVAGAATGGMDQAVCLRASAGHALLLDTGDAGIEQVGLDPAAAGLALLVIDTRTAHQLSDGQYAARRDACERAARELGVGTLAQSSPGDVCDAASTARVLARLTGHGADDTAMLRARVRHVLTEVARTRAAAALLRAGGLGQLGPLLDASHASLRDDYEVSCPELDTVTTAARSAGALGARMTGGGFGGSAIALVEAGAEAEVVAAVTAACATAGHPPPAFLIAAPSAGAQRLR